MLCDIAVPDWARAALNVESWAVPALNELCFLTMAHARRAIMAFALSLGKQKVSISITL